MVLKKQTSTYLLSTYPYLPFCVSLVGGDSDSFRGAELQNINCNYAGNSSEATSAFLAPSGGQIILTDLMQTEDAFFFF